MFFNEKVTITLQALVLKTNYKKSMGKIKVLPYELLPKLTL